ncbi:hypothetical protein PC128_g15143 [Phytophthora cactorum]|nr:hypothetical protein PC128_g15143 [Phytophthora cactorum]
MQRPGGSVNEPKAMGSSEPTNKLDTGCPILATGYRLEDRLLTTGCASCHNSPLFYTKDLASFLNAMTDDGATIIRQIGMLGWATRRKRRRAMAVESEEGGGRDGGDGALERQRTLSSFITAALSLSVLCCSNIAI